MRNIQKRTDGRSVKLTHAVPASGWMEHEVQPGVGMPSMTGKHAEALLHATAIAHNRHGGARQAADAPGRESNAPYKPEVGTMSRCGSC